MYTTYDRARTDNELLQIESEAFTISFIKPLSTVLSMAETECNGYVKRLLDANKK